MLDIAGINLFCSLMDICNGLISDAYYGALANILNGTKVVLDQVLSIAVNEKEKNYQREKQLLELCASGNRSWAKRMYCESRQ